MKKLICSMLLVFCISILGGCGVSDKSIMKTHGDLVITFLYDSSGSCIISKSVFNSQTGTCVEYTYFYDKNGHGEKIVAVTIVTIDKDGNVIDRVFNQLGETDDIEIEGGYNINE